MDQADQLDVLIVGAGISGIGCAYYLQRDHPHKRYAILEARSQIGGTWDLFRYPGVRSDSDLHTFGFAFKPWQSEVDFADGAEILRYIQETVKENGIDRHVRLGHRVTSAAWSSVDARWRVEVSDTGAGTTKVFSARWLLTGTGYYRYDHGYTPELPGIERFRGQVVHPQAWPAELDYAGKRVVVLGSGATAITLVPALSEQAGHVTMLQRSPSYILSVPSRDPLARLARRALGPGLGNRLTRRKNILQQVWVFRLCRRLPRASRAVIRRHMAQQLPDAYPVREHFNPLYKPWEQRLCIAPSGDFFRAIRRGRASVVTATIQSFTEHGIALSAGEDPLSSSRELEADIVITATGLELLAFGGIEFKVDDRPIELSELIAFKGMMLSGVPNLAFVVGYTNASWTLKVGLVGEHFCRLLTHMDQNGLDICTPQPRDPKPATSPLLDLRSGYLARSGSGFPRQGPAGPWRMARDFNVDKRVLADGPVTDPELHFSRRPRQPAASKPAAAIS